jgi:alginate O-acetyltransferase complex protein AlgI
VVFPTIEFAAFFVVVLTGSWLLMPHPRLWKPFILAASYVFYGYADIRFTLLLAAVTVVNQAAAVAVARWHDHRIVVAATAADLGLLGWFKYYGFFAESADSTLHSIGLGAPLPLLQVALPVGISFFTFQAISYVVDVARGDFAPAKTLDFAVYQAFFPHLVAGPIVRAREFIPQLASPRDPAAVPATRAFFLIGGGLVKKVVIADLLATRLVDPVFGTPAQHSPLEVLIAVYGYAVQIYCDFSAYTEMAIGLALLLGFQFPDNFDRPYAAVSLQDFWRRWHMTLSRWLRDYLYIALGGNRGGRLQTYRNLMLTMLLGGLWHGASWTFVVWGALHGGGLALERWWGGRQAARVRRVRRVRRLGAQTEPAGRPAGAFGVSAPGPRGERFPTGAGTAVTERARVEAPQLTGTRLPTVFGWLATFHFVCFAWIFFRAHDVATARTVLGRLVGGAGTASGSGANALVTPTVLVAIAVGLAVQFLPKQVWDTAQVHFARLGLVTQAALLATLLVVINAIVGQQGVAPFIYFRF